jgi:hypothetical protein
MDPISFSDITIVSCGTLSLDLNHLKKTGFLDACQILYPTPGAAKTFRRSASGREREQEKRQKGGEKQMIFLALVSIKC